jgi:hypothetical protein
VKKAWGRGKDGEYWVWGINKDTDRIKKRESS